MLKLNQDKQNSYTVGACFAAPPCLRCNEVPPKISWHIKSKYSVIKSHSDLKLSYILYRKSYHLGISIRNNLTEEFLHIKFYLIIRKKLQK